VCGTRLPRRSTHTAELGGEPAPTSGCRGKDVTSVDFLPASATAANSGRFLADTPHRARLRADLDHEFRTSPIEEHLGFRALQQCFEGVSSSALRDRLAELVGAGMLGNR
jgi:hypothetical protein